MRIVIGVDGSVPSRVALEMVAATDWPRYTAIRLVSATGTRAEGRRELSDEAERWTQTLLAGTYPTESVIARGRPADVLLAEADEVGADLIVVGNRGLSAAAALLGSVSAALVDQSPCPVLVVRRPTASRVLVATDGSRSAEAIPSVLLAWGAFKGASIDVLAVRPPPPDPAVDLSIGIPWILGGERHVLHATHDVDRYQVVAEDMAARLSRGGWSARPVVRAGDAAHENSRKLRRSRARTTSSRGSRGLSGLQRRLLGSVAHHVLLHSRCSVLVMRGHVPEREPLQKATPTAIASA